MGLFVFCGVAWLISENRRKVRVRTIIVGLSIQLIIGAVLLKIPLFRDLFLQINRIIFFLEQSTTAGASFVFGYLGGAPLPFEEKFPGAGFILAFRALPLILVVSALSSLLFYWKILPRIVRGFSWCLEKSMGLGGAEGLGIAANIFVGMVEAPLLIRPYLGRMTRSEVFSLMTCGMATIAGTVMVLYAGILSSALPGALGHILVASIISAPAAVTVAKIMVPETGNPAAGAKIESPDGARSAMDAVTRGTLQGAALLINIVAMLIVLVALVHLADLLLSLLPGTGGKSLTLQRLLGIAMAPVVWLMGIPAGEVGTAGALMGTKTILNELIAYLDMSRLPPGELSPRSMLILTYAMCGFANPGSLGIMIGGLGTIAPERRDEIVSLGFRSLVAGTLATSMTGAVVGVLGG
jgi:CNT family concentrative nucleoside transporter